MNNDNRRSGFTLIELLIVVVIIGMLAAIAVPKFQKSKERGFLAAAQSDLRSLVVRQEQYHLQNYQYASDLNTLGFETSTGVVLTINAATPTGWAATATHIGSNTLQCGVFVGAATAADAPPATIREVIACQL